MVHVLLLLHMLLHLLMFLLHMLLLLHMLMLLLLQVLSLSRLQLSFAAATATIVAFSAVAIACGVAFGYTAALVSTHLLGMLLQVLLLSCVQLPSAVAACAIAFASAVSTTCMYAGVLGRCCYYFCCLGCYPCCILLLHVLLHVLLPMHVMQYLAVACVTADAMVRMLLHFFGVADACAAAFC